MGVWGQGARSAWVRGLDCRGSALPWSWVVGAFVAGVYAALSGLPWHHGWPWLVGLALVGLACCGPLAGARGWSPWALRLALLPWVALSGALWCELAQERRPPWIPLAEEGVEGLYRLEVREGARPWGEGLVFMAHADGELGETRVEVRVSTAPPRWPVVGEVWTARGRLVTSSPPLHPWAFDGQAFDAARGVAGRLHVSEGLVRDARAGAVSWRSRWEARRQEVERTIVARVPPPADGVLLALVTASRGRLDPDIRQRFAAQGTAHVLAVSGLHLGLLVWTTYRLLAWLLGLVLGGRVADPGRWAALATVPLLGGLVLWTGGPPSVLRASAMALALLLWRMGGRPLRGGDALVLALAIVAMVDPLVLGSLGMQLSLGATAALLVGHRTFSEEVIGQGRREQVAWRAGAQGALCRWLRRQRGRLAWCRGARWLRLASVPLGACWRWVAAGAWASWLATWGTAPVLVMTFGALPLLSVLPNLVVVPPLALLALPACLGALALEHLGWAHGAGAGWWLAEAAVAWSLSWSTWGAPLWERPWVVGMPALVAVLGWCLVSLGFVLQGRRWWSTWWWLVAAGGLLAWWGRPQMEPLEPGGFWMHAIPVGHGDATLVTFAEGGRWLVDAGGAGPAGGGVGRRLVQPYLYAQGIGGVDVFVASHAHVDHYGGLLELIGVLRPRALWVGEVGDEAPEAWRDLMDEAARWGVEVVVLDERPGLYRWGSVEVTVYPRGGPEARAGVNDRSLVLRLCAAGHCAWLGGDIERAREADLVALGWPMAAVVAKLNHHGSSTSSTEVWWDAVNPGLVIAHAARGGRFSFPSAGPRRAARARGVPLVTTSDGLVPVVWVGPSRVAWGVMGRGPSDLRAWGKEGAVHVGRPWTDEARGR